GDRRAPVASCPGWDVAALAVHLGTIQRWATEMVRTAATERLEGRDERFGFDGDDSQLAAWMREGAGELVAALSDAPLDQPVWCWTGEGGTAGLWRRIQAHEAAVHRWDAESAVGTARPIEAALASDGVDEILTLVGQRRARPRSTVLGEGESFHFHCTDVEGEW